MRHTIAPDGEPGLCDKLRDVTSHRYSKNGVFGLHHRFILNDIQTSLGEIDGDNAEVQMCSSTANVNNNTRPLLKTKLEYTFV